MPLQSHISPLGGNENSNNNKVTTRKQKSENLQSLRPEQAEVCYEVRKISEGIQMTKHLLQNSLLLKNHTEHCALTPAVYLEVSIQKDTHLAPWRVLTRSQCSSLIAIL